MGSGDGGDRAQWRVARN